MFVIWSVDHFVFDGEDHFLHVLLGGPEESHYFLLDVHELLYLGLVVNLDLRLHFFLKIVHKLYQSRLKFEQ